MNKRGLELAISTIVVLVIAIAVLVGLVLFLTKGFGLWKSGVEPIGNSVSVSAVREACNLACNTDHEITFCCERYSLNEGKVTCTDAILNVDCAISCAAVSCPA